MIATLGAILTGLNAINNLGKSGSSPTGLIPALQSITGTDEKGKLGTLEQILNGLSLLNGNRTTEQQKPIQTQLRF